MMLKARASLIPTSWMSAVRSEAAYRFFDTSTTSTLLLSRMSEMIRLHPDRRTLASRILATSETWTTLVTTLSPSLTLLKMP